MTPTLRAVSLVLLLSVAFSQGPVAQCNIADFGTHTCHENLINLTSPAITTGAQCAAACCANNTKTITCTYAGWQKGACFIGDVHTQSVCKKDGGWKTYLIDWTKTPTPAPQSTQSTN
jgi:hypothetical protein